jgi:hypothetical protein
MDFKQIKYFLKEELKKVEESLRSDGGAFFYSNQGKKEALQDTIQCIELFGKKFKKYMKIIRKVKFKNKKPNYSKVCDKSNADSWYIFGYNRVFYLFFKGKNK